MTILVGWSFEALGGEAGQLIVFGGVADLDGIAANFAILDVDLTGNGEIEDHGDLFSAVRAHEAVFHREIGYDTKRDPSQKHPGRKRRGEILRSSLSLRMTMLVASSLHLNLEGAVGGLFAVSHVATCAGGLGRFEGRGGLIEFSLIDQHVDLG